MPELVAPTVLLHTAWREAHAEWGPGRHEDGFGLHPDDDVGSPAGFAAWVTRLTDQPERSGPVPPGRTCCRYRWIVESDRVLGGIALRHGHDDVVSRLGHIGYGIRPSARRRGLASWALGKMLAEAWGSGLDRVLIVCEAGNIASARTIERHGGVLDDDRHGGMRRYWIEAGHPPQRCGDDRPDRTLPEGR
jgi:predicted acetyltransferase